MFVETHTRSIVKALSWRAVSTILTVAIVFLLTRKVALALKFGGLEIVALTTLHVVHERVWNKIHFGRKHLDPAVIWFTGLSGSGKTTLARKLFDYLKERGVKVEYLDGDSLRHIFPKTGFTRDERDMHVRRVGHLASTLEKNGVFVVASFISPYADSRKFVRGLCRNFVEVYVSTPLEECEKRDVKGLYAKARRGEIRNFTGIDDPYEAPSGQELTLDTSRLSQEQAFLELSSYVSRKFLNGAS